MQSISGFAFPMQSEFGQIIGRSGCRLRETGTCHVLQPLIERADNFINVGPHVGLFALLRWAGVGKLGIVLSIQLSLQFADCVQHTLSGSPRTSGIPK